MTVGPLAAYRALINDGTITADPAQRLAIEKLQLLANRLATYEPPKRTDFFSFFTRRRGEVPFGLYMFGGVGRGKTMLMDLFFETVPFEPKWRVHFHEFMGEVHDRIADARKSHEGDPIPVVAQSIADEAKLLCFDEMHVTDIADAMILGRLFASFFEMHMVIVATSNAAPEELYKDGLNRTLFEPFIELIGDRMEVLQLEAAKDYRLERLEGTQLYFSPADDDARAAMDETFTRLTGVSKGETSEIVSKGRHIRVPQAALGVARFTFADLCEQPLGAGDYIRIAHTFHTVLLDNIPILTPDRRNEARRFINLIDTFYDNRVRLIASADAEPGDLYPSGDGANLFERTVSRLMEMRSETYIAS